MSRKNLLIVVTIFFFIGAGYLLYQFFKPSGEVITTVPTTTVTNPFGNFFPDTNIPATTPATSPATTSPATIQFNDSIANLRKISNVPIAGGTVFEKTATSTDGLISSTVFRYVERATGHIYETFATSTTSNRISNTTIPKIYEAFFLNNKDQVVFRYLDAEENIDTYVATINASTTEMGEVRTTLEGVFMQKNIYDLSVSADGKNIFALSPNINTASASILLGQVVPSNNIARQTTIFNSPISSWNAEWNNNNNLVITTKPSYNAHGIAYFLNTQTNTRSKILGPIIGLMTKASPDGRKVLYSKNDGTGISTQFINVSSGLTKKVPVATLAEKCVWSKDNKNVYCAVPNISLVGQYPDLWYMGLVSFNDTLVKIDTELESVQTIMAVNSETSEPLDMVDLQLSPKEDFLIFTNKRDLSFWSLDILRD